MMSAPTPDRSGSVATPIGRHPSQPRRETPGSLRTPTTGLRATPGGGRRTPGTAARTPHARAALLALDSRRAAKFTPGGRKSRRKSGRVLRESPRDLLRNLSRRLAPVTERIVSSSPAVSAASASSTKEGERSVHGRGSFRNSVYEDDDSLPLDRPPRMSLPIVDEDDDDNDDDLKPHRSTILEQEDENLTMRSIEFARRTATQEQLQQARRFSRASLGSLRMSDYIEGFMGPGEDDATEQEERMRSEFFPEGVFDHLGDELPEDLTFERVDTDDRRDTSLGVGRESGLGDLDLQADGNETTFLLGADIGGQDDQPLVDEGAEAGDAFDGQPEPELHDIGNDPMAWEDEDIGNGSDIPDVTFTEKESARQKNNQRLPRAKRVKVSRYGIPYPSLPAGVVKRVAQTFARGTGAGKAKISPDTIAALTTASDWFFEQVGGDLHRYAKHAGRKTIDESDMLLLMKRQRKINTETTPFSLAQRLLPRELLQELRMVPEPSLKKRKPKSSSATRTAAAAADAGEDGT